MRRFVRIELGDEVVPDETTILCFRHLLEQHGLTQDSGAHYGCRSWSRFISIHGSTLTNDACDAPANDLRSQ
jgi:IS5 family transposase